MVLGKHPVPGAPANLDDSRARASALVVGAGWGCLDIFSFIYHFSRETTRYILKYYLKGPFNPNKQPTNHRNLMNKTGHLSSAKEQPYTDYVLSFTGVSSLLARFKKKKQILLLRVDNCNLLHQNRPEI